MSTAAEIESAIAKLSPEDFRLLREWVKERAAATVARQWTSEELEAGAKRMLDEPDPAKADALWEEVVAGFYGEPRT
ncbi:MAG TPA: hypothetical protein VGO11_25515 [Chthoniobacteraceae bacterium]|jgi:hypothetical protein|nr:hypothetical protein [Chthoniobacteraceae bacterium]